MDLESIYQRYKESYLVSTDTRNIIPNSIFFALKGGNFNGNKFAKEALNNGASYCIVDEEEYVTCERVILVDNVLKTLQGLAKLHRKTLGVKIISLTGSNGKTTTKELITRVLSQKYNVSATIGNLNNHIGVPLTLLAISLETEIAVVEMGANNPNEIAFLSDLIQPDYGYITNFGKAHLEGFGSVEGVIKAKSELYDFLRDNNKTVFVNPDDGIQLSKTDGINRILFDENLSLDSANPFVNVGYDNLVFKTNLIGKYNYSNVAAAITMGTYFGVCSELISIALSNYYPDNNRSQILTKGSNMFILDAYNANPTSMSAAIQNFNSLEADSKVLILGDMFELGKDSLNEHQAIVDLLSNLDFSNVYLLGDNFYKVKTDFNKYKEYDEMISAISNVAYKNTQFLIKGSRGMSLERCMSVFTD